MKNINKVENKKATLENVGQYALCSKIQVLYSLNIALKTKQVESALLSEELFLCNLVLPHGMFSLKPFDLSEKTWTVIGQTFYHILSGPIRFVQLHVTATW